MGWAGGTELVINAWRGIREYIEPEDRASALIYLIEAASDQDWDCLEEIIDEFEEAREALVTYDPNLCDYLEEYDRKEDIEYIEDDNL